MRRKNIINEVTNRVIKEKYRLDKLIESIEYDPEHPERMNPDL